MNRTTHWIFASIIIGLLCMTAIGIAAPKESEAQVVIRSYDELQQNKRAQADTRAVRQLEKIVDVLQDISSTLNDIEDNQRELLRRVDDIKRKVR